MSEDTFTRELERRAEAVHPRHLGFEEVRASARRIRRRRRALAAGAAAAAVAAALVVPGVLTGGDGRRSGPDPAPSPAPAPGHTAVLHDGAVTLPGGQSVDLGLRDSDVTQLGVLTDGRVVVATSRPYAVQVFSPDGERTARYDVQSNAITMSADDDLVAWVDESFRVQVLESGVAEPTTFAWGIPMPGESAGSIDAVLGSGCAEGGCTVLGGDFTTTTTELGSSGPGTDLVTSEPLRITDVSPDGERWAVEFPPTSESQQFGCAGLYDAGADTVLERSCATSGLRFAPDGQHLLGMRGDNAMSGQVEVYDDSLGEVLVYDPGEDAVVKGAAWDDSAHLLVVTVTLGEDPQWSVVRVPVDGGAPATVTGPVDGPDAERESFRLSE